jgi:hypothetical protein
MCPLQEAKSEPLSRKLGNTSREKSPREPSSQDSYLVITRLERVDRNTGAVLEAYVSAQVEKSEELPEE